MIDNLVIQPFLQTLHYSSGRTAGGPHIGCLLKHVNVWGSLASIRFGCHPTLIGFCFGGVIPLIFPNAPQSGPRNPQGSPVTPSPWTPPLRIQLIRFGCASNTKERQTSEDVATDLTERSFSVEDDATLPAVGSCCAWSVLFIVSP